MRKVQLLIAMILLTLSCQEEGVVFESAICIENITTIDPIDGLKEHQTLIIQDGIISKIVASADINLSSENNIIDGTDKYIIPGLWDAHVHFAFMEELAPSMLNLFLGYGITSVRDTGGQIDFVKKYKDLALKNPQDAPRVMIAGPLLDGMPNVYDGSDAKHPPLSIGSANNEDLLAQIKALDSSGVDLLKAYEMLTPEQFEVITNYGKEHNLKVTGHVPLSMDVISASNAGLSSLEHMRNLELSCASNANELWEQRKQLLADGKNDPGGVLRSRIHDLQRQTAVENYDDKQADEVLAVLAKNQTWQIPTLALNTGMTNRHFANAMYQKSFNYLPESVEQLWKNSIETVLKNDDTPVNAKYTDWKMNMVGKIHEAEIDIMAGTDCPIFFLTPGLSLHEELALLVDAGLSPLEALKTATVNPAKYFNMDNTLGTINENMIADLLILDANPLINIRNTTNLNAVIKGGKYHNRIHLDEILKR